MTKFHSGGYFLLPHGNHFSKKHLCARTPLPEVAVSLIIMQIRQPLPQH